MFIGIRKYLLFGLLAFLAVSCYEEFTINPEYENNVFNFLMDPDQEQKIYESRGEKVLVYPSPIMYYGNVQYKLDRFGTRGQSALNVRRKSYAVNTDGFGFVLYNADSTDLLYFEKFKLLAMAYDFTYIENKLSHLVLDKIGLWELTSFFSEVKLNNNHQGLYLFVESPDDFVSKHKSAHAIIRRYYNHEISSIEVFPKGNGQSADFYADRFNTIYKVIKDFKGKQLYDNLNHLMVIDKYMRKMVIDYIIGNADYTDEIFFYAIEQEDGSIQFDIIPWDYDDIFNSVAHEVGRDWAVGTTFGERVYTSQQDVLDVLGGRLIFSVEDDLDYIISQDDFLYTKYLENMEWVLSRVNTAFIEEVFLTLQEELVPFYEIPEVIEQSKNDANETSMEIFLENLANKKNYLIARLDQTRSKFETQKLQSGL